MQSNTDSNICNNCFFSLLAVVAIAIAVRFPLSELVGSEIHAVSDFLTNLFYIGLFENFGEELKN